MSATTEARLLLLGWNFRGGAVSVRDRIAFSGDEVREALERIRGRGLMTEGVIVATCHRSEIYGVTEESEAGPELTRLISDWRGVDFAEATQSSFSLEGAEAVRHLFRVAAGLDSMALGESEVLGQIRSALRLARETGTTRAVLHRLFESAVAAGKRARTETEIARHPLSVASIGFELATKVFGEIADQTVLVLGAGETGSSHVRSSRSAAIANSSGAPSKYQYVSAGSTWPSTVASSGSCASMSSASRYQPSSVRKTNVWRTSCRRA